MGPRRPRAPQARRGVVEWVKVLRGEQRGEQPCVLVSSGFASPPLQDCNHNNLQVAAAAPAAVVQASEGQGRRDGGGEVADFQRPRASCCVSCSVCSSNSLPFVHALRALCCCEIPLRPRLLDPSLIGLLLFLLLVDSFFAKYKKNK